MYHSLKSHGINKSLSEDHSSEALLMNRDSRMKANLLAQMQADRDEQVIPLISPNNKLSLASLGDEHYAISENEVDAVRASHKGNWMNDSHLAFQSEHRHIIEHEGPEDDEADIDKSHCQCILGPGLCKMQTGSMLYIKLMEDAKNALRLARSFRRSKGFVPEHVPLLLVQSLENEEDVLLEIYLLTRLSFSPLDATATTWHWTSRQTGIARLTLVDEMPEFHTLSCLIYKIASSHEHKDQPVRFKTATYSALSLCEIQVSNHQSLDSFSPAPQVNDEPESSSDDDLKSRLQLIRRAAGKELPRARGRGRGKSSASRGATTATLQRSTTKTKTQTQTQTAVAADERIHTELMQDWSNALADHLGPMSVESKDATATSSTQASSSLKGSCPIPVVSYTHPWRDANGYCWVFNEKSSKPYPLGRELNIS